MKNLGVHEKQEVGLEERKKHAAGKAKKLKKSIQDVRTTILHDHNIAHVVLGLESQAGSRTNYRGQ